jgi:microcystin-dependent protein
MDRLARRAGRGQPYHHIHAKPTAVNGDGKVCRLHFKGKKMTLYKWSQTASADATADSTINWAEGQAPSSVNDSARAMMAATAKFRDDIAGAIVTTGTSTSYQVTSYQDFDSLAHLNGQMIAFTPHATNGANGVNLNVDGTGSKPLRTSPGADLLAGTIVQGTPYVAVYNNSDGVFYLRGFFGNPYNVPLGAGMDYWLPTAPNSSFVFPIGQAISRTTYATLFAAMGTTYGPGDGSTTFNLPDKTGRVSAMREATATRLTTAVGGIDGGTMGATGGLQSETLTIAQLPVVTPAGTVVTTTLNQGYVRANSAQTGTSTQVVVDLTNSGSNQAFNISANSTFTGTPFGSGNAHPNVQPTIVCNYIIRII